jgi:ion channel-forming bestrophin family protein
MSTQKNYNWLKNTLHLKHSVLPKIALRVLFCTVFAVFIALLYSRGYPVSVAILANIIPSVLLGLLLVFRTNTANDRFWEGRKLWGEINNNIRNITRQIWLVTKHQENKNDQKEFLELLWLYSILVKDSLRSKTDSSVGSETFEHISNTKLNIITTAKNSPLVAMSYLQKSLVSFKSTRLLDQYETAVVQKLLDSLTNCLGGCQRILKTPIPLAYSIHLNQLVLIYCLSLPFQFVGVLGWFMIPVVGITSFAVMGIEEIGTEIENPFGKDTNDLPIDDICIGIKTNIDELMEFEKNKNDI